MTLWAIVPVKPLRRGKSRLAGTLSEDERAELNRILLEHTIQTLTDLKEIEQVLVVSRDSAALALARDLGARTVQEDDGAPSLNTALKRATVVAQVYASRGVLIIPADLPLLNQNDVKALLEHSINPPVVVIAPTVIKKVPTHCSYRHPISSNMILAKAHSHVIAHAPTKQVRASKS